MNGWSRPGRLIARVSSRSGSPCGPATSLVTLVPTVTGATGKAWSQSEAERRRAWSPSSICQYQPESGCSKRGSPSCGRSLRLRSGARSLPATTPSSSTFRRASKLRSTVSANRRESAYPPTLSRIAHQIAALATRRKARELRFIRRTDAVAESARRLDHVDAELPAQAADEHLDGVGIPVEVLVVQMLGQLGARHDPARMVHQIGEQAVFLGGQ